MKNIAREIYLKNIRPFIGKQIIKVIIGQRRTGKSYILKQISKEIEKNNTETHCIFLDKEQSSFSFIQNDTDLLTFVEETQKKAKKEKIALFIDEVQEILHFEKALRELIAREGFDIYISGSNANILSSELSTLLSGRYIEKEIYPLSYSEFLLFHQKEKGKESFLEYIKYGGLPYLIHLPLEEEIIYDYLKNIHESIFFKDIIKRYAIRNVSFLENLVSFLAENIGSIVSAKKISDYLKSQKIQISPNIVLNYLSHLSDVFFILEVRRKEIGKKIFEVGSKHYFGDIGIRNSLVGYAQSDIGKILENLVFLHLKVWGYTVYVGKKGEKEIDFIAEKQGERKYIQVSSYISDKKVHQREFGNLLEIPDNYEKIVVSLDDYIGGSYKGIQHLHALDFLAQEKF